MKKKNKYNFVFRSYLRPSFYTTVMAYSIEDALDLMNLMFSDTNYFLTVVSADVLDSRGFVRIGNNTNNITDDIPKLFELEFNKMYYFNEKDFIELLNEAYGIDFTNNLYIFDKPKLHMFKVNYKEFERGLFIYLNKDSDSPEYVVIPLNMHKEHKSRKEY